MKLLLDTNALIFAFGDSGRLTRKARQAIDASENEIYFSAAGIWEIATKEKLGKLPPLLNAIQRGIRKADYTELPITATHAGMVADLELHHRDPFDRILVAQALAERMTIVTRDPLFNAYPVAVLLC